MDFEMSYGESIKKARKKAGITQKELAKRTGLAEITIRQYEANKREPRSNSIKKIAIALDIPVSELLGDFVLSKMDFMFKELEEEGVYQPEDYEPGNFYCIDEDYIISLVRQLNYDGLSRIDGHLEDLLKIPEYRKSDTTDLTKIPEYQKKE